MMITHYGLNWSERDVLWSGWRGSPGQLLGRERVSSGRRGAAHGQQAAATDYSNFIGVYCLYGEGDLIYIGETGLDTKRTLFQRLKAHRSGAMAGRWDSFSWFGRANCVGDVKVKPALQQLEAISIAIINPGFNKQAGCFAGAKQVYQVPHEESVGDVDTRLDRIEDALGELTEFIGKLEVQFKRSR